MRLLPKIILTLAFFTFIISGFGLIQQPTKEDPTTIASRRKAERSQDVVLEKKIDDLLSKMTLQEKIGQMTQLNNSQISTNAQWGAGADLKIEIKVDTARLGKILRKYHVGSFLNGIAVSP